VAQVHQRPIRRAGEEAQERSQDGRYQQVGDDHLAAPESAGAADAPLGKEGGFQLVFRQKYLLLIAIMLLVTFTLFSLIIEAPTSYLNIIGFLVLPGILVAGMFIVPAGMAINYVWRVRGIKKGRMTSLPRIDLNDSRTRKAVLWFLAASIALALPALAVSSYEGYRYTESTAFCANVCHTVMEPQAVAHARSRRVAEGQRDSESERCVARSAGGFQQGVGIVHKSLGHRHSEPQAGR